MKRSSLLAVGSCVLGILLMARCGKEDGPTAPLVTVPNLPSSVATLPPPVTLPPAAPMLDAHTSPNPATGNVPLALHLNACQSADPNGDELAFSFDFGDGKQKPHAFCRQTHTYTSRGTYAAKVCVSDRTASVCRVFNVTVS